MAITTLGDNFRVIIEGGSGARFAALAEASGARFAAIAQAAASSSEAARDVSITEGPFYTSILGGEAATTAGQPFAVASGDGTVAYYRRTAGGSEEIFQPVTAANAFRSVTTDQAELLDSLTDGTVIFVTDQYGGSYWRAKDTAQVIEGQASTAYTFEDEMTFYRTASGKPFVFDIDMNLALVRKLERKNYQSWFTKQRRRDQAQNIAMYGDSLTFGQAGVSAVGASNLIGVATGYGDGSSHAHWQYDQHVSKELSDGLGEVRAGALTVHNRGFSGDTAVAMYLRHRSPPTSGVSIIWPTGINDVSGATSSGATLSGLETDAVRGVSAYREACRRFAVREILRGNAIVLMSGPNFVGGSGWDGTTHSSMRAARAYETALAGVADELGIHFINTRREILDQYFIYDIQADGTHLNPTGTKVVGRRLAALFVGEGWRSINRVTPGSVLIASDATNNILSEALTPVVINVSSGGPGLISANPTSLSVTNGDPIMLSFFAETDDTIVYINGKADGSSVTVDLDGQALQQDYKSALSAGKTGQPSGTAALSTVTRTYTGAHFTNRATKRWGASDTLAIHVVGRGYHTITVSVGASGTFNVDSLEFQAWENERSRNIAFRTEDGTAIQNNTFTADPALKLPVMPNKSYAVEGCIYYSSGTTPAFKWYLLGPTFWTAKGAKSGAHPIDEINMGATVTETGSANARVMRFTARVTTGAAAGDLTFMFAQVTTTASDTKILAGSWLKIVADA